MTVAEMQKAIEQLKAEGHSEEDILGSFYKMFQNDELSIEELDGITNLMGYHLTDEFAAMSPEDQKTKGYEETSEPAEGVNEKEIEEAKEDENGEKPAEEKPEEKFEEKPEGESEEKPEGESEEKARAMKLFNLGK